MDETTGFPSSFKFSNVKGSVIVPTSLESNVIELHKFLYGDEAYTPSSTVLANSQRTLEIVGGEASLDDTQTSTAEENTTNDTVIYENNGSSWSDTTGSSDSDYSGDTDYSGGDSDYSGGDNDYSGGDNDYSGGGDYSDGSNDDYSGDGNTGGGDDYSGGDSGSDDSGYTEDGTGEDVAIENIDAA